MSLSKFIHDYLDGELNETQKEALFAELAESPDQRREFDQQVRLHTIAKNDMSSITPPVESTSAIFSSLGFSLPSDDYLNRVSGAGMHNGRGWSSGKFARYFRKGMPFMIVAFFASVVSIGLYYGIDNSSKIAATGDNASSLNGSSIPVVSSFAEIEEDNSFTTGSYLYGEDGNGTGSESGSTVQYTAGSNPSRSSMSGMTGRRENIRASTTEDNTNSFERGEISDIVTLGDHVNTLDANSDFYASLDPDGDGIISVNITNINIGRPGFEPLINDPQVLNIWQGFENKKMGAELRMLSSSTSSVDSKVEAGGGGLKDFALAYVFNFNKNHSLGIEAGREQFPQVFEHNNGTYNQSPEILWYGAFYRFSVPEFNLLGMIYPYAQAFVGGSSVGPMGRAQIGMIFRPANNLSFTIGGEFAYLLYNVDGELYKSDKLGFTWGINYYF